MITGIVNINKPLGKSSAFVVAVVRRITKIKKVGHTGTLDPLATGVLPICIGRESTRLADFIMQGTKEYLATVELGKTTTTQDSEGEVLTEKEVTVTKEELEKIIKSFIGEISQIPPMYSAIKINGQKMYELARKGVEVERKPRTVTIYNIDIKEINLPYAKILVTCSKGTYIRTLCADIGEKAGCGGYMKDLIRTKSGRFHIEDSVTLEEFEDLWNKGEGDKFLLSPDEFKSE